MRLRFAVVLLSSLIVSPVSAQEDQGSSVPSEVYAERLEARDPHHLITIAEEALWLSLGTVWYVIDDRNVADFDLDSWSERFSAEGWSLDNNHFPINWAGHPLSGAAYYAFPRANDMSVPVALAYAFGTSFAWEFFIEFREKNSVNDLITTSGAGFAIGEFAHRFWRYFSGLAPKSSTASHVMAALLGTPVYVRRGIYGEAQTTPGPYDAYGLSEHVRPQLWIGYTARLHDADETAATHGFHFGGRLSSLPGEGRPGDHWLFFYDADVTSLRVHGGVGESTRDWELDADTHILGVQGQDIDQDGNGWQGLLAWNIGYHYRFFDAERFNDRLALLHLPGLGLDAGHRGGLFSLSSRIRFNGDFVGVGSYAYQNWARRELREDSIGKSVLAKHGYYYGWGATAQADLVVGFGPVHARAAGRMGTYDSQEGLDRNQAVLTVDPNLTDRLHELQVGAGVTLSESPALQVEAEWMTSRRRSTVEDVVVQRGRQRWGLSVGLGL